MSKNVAVFVDVANIFYAAKAAGVDIDYVTLLKSAVAGRDFVRAYAYTGLDPDNENQRNFHAFLARHDYKVVSKDIRKYGDGKVKANLDIELVVDMMKTARNLDVAIVVSGDGDFAPAIRAVQEMGVRVEVISFRGNTSSDLIEVADVFTDIVQLARVEKGSSRSGRRVADDGEDLSMTEVPDKMTEGTGRGRGRGTGRGRSRTGEPAREPVAASGARPAARGGRGRTAEVAVEAAGGTPVGLVALPGEKLSKAAQARLDAAAVATEEDAAEGPETTVAGEADEAEGQRRRRRRGGRGRGRGRGRGEGEAETETGGARDAGTPAERVASATDEGEDEEELEAVAGPPRAPRPGAFGSVWDSQIGQTRVPSVETTPFDIEDEDEPAIPEYLIAEQRRASARGGARGRGGARAGYASAVDRERYGRGGSTGGVNRYPDVSGRAGRPAGGGGQGGRGGRGAEVRRDDRSAAPRPDRDRGGSGRSDEPWSEVPPELEALLRAQLAAKGDSRPAEGSRGRPSRAEQATAKTPAGAATGTEAPAEAPAKRRPSTRAKAAPAAEAPAGTAEAAAPKRRAPARATAKTPAGAATGTEAPAEAPAKRRPSTRAKAAPAAEAPAGTGETAEVHAPKRRAPARKKAEAPDA